MPKSQILVLGATGYIGGSFLTELIALNVDNAYTISALVRKPTQANSLEVAGVTPLLFKDLDDFDTIRNAAEDHDIIVAAASARHADCAKACLAGLGNRLKKVGTAVHYIHVSGTSMVGDWPVTGERTDTSVHSDADEDIFETENQIPDSFGPVRKVNQLVVQLGLEKGVKTYIVPLPLICKIPFQHKLAQLLTGLVGRGSGLFTPGSGQINMLTELSMKYKHAVMIGTGSGIWNRVHIQDLSNMFYLLVQAIAQGRPDLLTGKKGYYFVENGFQTWKSISESIGKVGKELGAFDSDRVSIVDLKEVADDLFGGDEKNAESVLASNSRSKADHARQLLGWDPRYGEEDFNNEIRNVVTEMYKGKSN